VHKDTVVACVRIVAEGKTKQERRSFSTATDQLVELRAWLEECRCRHVAMEATGVYWMPVFRILGEGVFELIVANAAHIKNVPGRKTDVNDATWIADLLACGLITASFVPNEEIQELRSLTRTRKQLVREQTRHVQRIEQTLAEANIKLNSVISDIMGASGRRMIEAMIRGVRQPRQLAELAGKGIKATPKELYDALHGRLTEHHRFLLDLHLRQWDGLDETIRSTVKSISGSSTRTRKVGAAMSPFAP
jgi:transposase